jgi:3-deoxy-7-phosphoheptulonate synthase
MSTTSSSSGWSPSSWRGRPIKQQAQYKDPRAAEAAVSQIASLPPLVQPHEVDLLRSQLAQVVRGERFLLQGGDCAETFADCNQESLDSKLKILLQMSLVLVWGAQMPVVRVGRIAGQYAKPRSNPTEKTKDGVEVPVFKGDIINGTALEDREHDPARLVQAYFHSAASLNYIRGRLDSGFGDLHRAADWDLDFVRSEAKREEYSGILRDLRQCLGFLKACGMGESSAGGDSLRSVNLFSSHEGLLLEYEEALTRQGSKDSEAPKGYYNLGAHLLWIGDRTRQLDGAHIEYFRGIRNPIGLKVGPTTDAQELLALIRVLDPDNTPGKLIIYTRLGAAKVAELLPGFIKIVRDAGCTSPLWACDPMHGNTITSANGYKTRRFEDVTILFIF